MVTYLHHGDDGVIDGILVLEQPPADVVTNASSIMMNLKVSLGFVLLFGLS